MKAVTSFGAVDGTPDMDGSWCYEDSKNPQQEQMYTPLKYSMVQCDVCKHNFHWECIADPSNVPILKGDCHYYYTCKTCTAPKVVGHRSTFVTPCYIPCARGTSRRQGGAARLGAAAGSMLSSMMAATPAPTS